jgi:hypothetical protein
VRVPPWQAAKSGRGGTLVPVRLEADHAAGAAAGRQAGEGVLHVVQRDLVGDQRAEVQPAGAVVVDQHRKVGGGVAVAVHAAGQRAGEVGELERVEAERVGARAEPDHGGAAAAAGDRPGRADRLGPADALDRVVGAAPAGERPDPPAEVGGGCQHVGGAQPPGQVGLVAGHLDRDDRVRPGDPRALHRGEAHPAEPEHHHRLARPDPGGVADRADAGQHGAAEQRRLDQRDVGWQADAGVGADHRLGGEGADAEARVDRRAVAEPAVGPLRRVPRPLAQVRLALQAEPAGPARRRPVEHHRVTRGQPRDALADGGHGAGALVTEHGRDGLDQRAAGQRQVGMADAGRGQSHPDLAGSRFGQLDVLDCERTADTAQDRRLDDRAHGAPSRPPRPGRAAR